MMATTQRKERVAEFGGVKTKVRGEGRCEERLQAAVAAPATGGGGKRKAKCERAFCISAKKKKQRRWYQDRGKQGLINKAVDGAGR